MTVPIGTKDVAKGALVTLAIRGAKGHVALPGSFLPGDGTCPGQMQDDIRVTLTFRTAKGDNVKTVVKGDVLGVEMAFTDSNGEAFEPDDVPAALGTKQDGASAFPSTSMEAQGGGKYLLEFDTSAQAHGPLTITTQATMPSGKVVKRSENVELVRAEGA